jgi:hypothetical protein
VSTYSNIKAPQKQEHVHNDDAQYTVQLGEWQYSSQGFCRLFVLHQSLSWHEEKMPACEAVEPRLAK